MGELLQRGSGWQLDVDRDSKQVASLEAQLRSARWDRDHTQVRASGTGWVANTEALQVGARVVSLPIQQAMALVDDKRIVLAQIRQIYLRHIEPGQPVEVTFKIVPGEVLTGTVEMGRMSGIYVIRRVVIWMDAWLNYILPA